MLASIKRKTKGWVAYLIVGIIAIPFAFFGIHDYVNNHHNITVASVDGEKISGSEYYEQLGRLVRVAQEQLGDEYNLEIENSLREQAINSLIDRKVLENIASSLGYATVADEIKDMILSNETFFKDGVFDLETYNSILAVNGMTPRSYEEDLLTMNTLTQLRNNLQNSAFLSKTELDILGTLTNEQRNISFTTVNVADFSADLLGDISEAEIASYYETNIDAFTYPDTITIDYITLDYADIMASIEVSEAELLEQYEVEKERYLTEEQRNASHILVAESSLADEIKTKLDNGADFAALAGEFSIDTTNAEDGGSLGFFSRGIMVPEFEDVAFSMNVGEISTPIQTEFGYHIIKLDEVSEERTKPLAELRTELTTSIKESKARLQMLERSEQLQNIVYEQGIEIAAEDLGLTLTTSEPLTRDSDKLPQIIVNTAFSEEVSNTNEAVVVEVDENIVMALRSNTFTPSKAKTLEEATAEITTIVRSQRARKLANDYANDLVNNKRDLDNSLGWVYRNDEAAADASVINTAFSTPKDKEYATRVTDSDILITRVSGIRVQEREEPIDYSMLYPDYSEELFNDISKYIKGLSAIQIYDIQSAY